MNNITKARCASRNTTTSPLYQYDYGQILKIVGLSLPNVYEVHFSNTDNIGTATTSLGNKNGVVIPDEYLTSGEDIYAWLFLHYGEDDGRTVFKIHIPVKKKPQVTDAQPTPVQQDIITQAIAVLNETLETIPAHPTEDGTYVLKCTVEDGVVTSTWDNTYASLIERVSDLEDVVSELVEIALVKG